MHSSTAVSYTHLDVYKRQDMYENWTDVSGVLVTDPRIVENPEVIETLSLIHISGCRSGCSRF